MPPKFKTHLKCTFFEKNLKECKIFNKKIFFNFQKRKEKFLFMKREEANAKSFSGF